MGRWLRKEVGSGRRLVGSDGNSGGRIVEEK